MSGTRLLRVAAPCGSSDRPARRLGFARAPLGLLATALILVPSGATAAAATPLPPRTQAIVARVDSLWLAQAREEAHALVRLHLPGARAVGDSLLLLHLLARQGQMWAVHNRSRDALPPLREALALADTLQVEDLGRACRRWLGVALYAEGSLEEGASRFRELLDLSRASGDTLHEGYAWMGLAYDDWHRDRSAEAREKYERAAALLQAAGDERGEVWARIGLNIALSQLGDYPRALEGNRRIVEIGRDTGLRSAEALGHNNLGALLYSLGDPGEALAHFEQARRILEQEGDLRESIVAARNVGVCEVTLGRTRAALERMDGLLELSRRQGHQDLRTGLLIHMAEAYRRQGANSTAARLQRDALSLGDRLSLKERSEALLGLAEALAAMDSSRAALALLQDAAPEILHEAAPLEACRFRIGLGRRLTAERRWTEAEEILAPVDAEGGEHGLAGVRLEALPMLARARRARGDPEGSLALLRQARDLWEADRAVPLDPLWREQRGAAASDLFSQLATLLLEPSAGRSREERARDAFEVLQAYKARTLLERMRGPGGVGGPAGPGEHGGSGGSGGEAQPFAPGDFRARTLGPDEVFIDVLAGPEALLLFACTREECRAVALPGSRAWAAKLRLYHELLSTPPPGDGDGVAPREIVTRASRELSAALLAPFADLIQGCRRVILSPDGVFNLVPLTALLPSTPPLECCCVPAASVLAELRGRGAERSAADRILALADPRDVAEALPGTGREVSWLRGRFERVDTAPAGRETTPALGENATAAWPARVAPYEVLHFAMHSAADDQAPWRSTVVLGVDSGGGASTVSAAEIAQARISARLVVLSCCESARGTILSGEGVQGLASAFLAAGARAVLATLWTVDDAVAARFMERFYGALSDGESASGAVRSAQGLLRATPATAHPFYWAGFQLVGDGDLRLDLPRARGGWTRLAATGALAGGLILLAGACLWRTRRGV